MVKIIIEKLTYFRRNIYYKAEEFITARNCTAFLFFPRSAHPSKESYIGRILDLPADRRITKMTKEKERLCRNGEDF